MTKVTFENATIRDVIGKASKIAPTKGSAFDKAAGILLEVDSANEQVVVKATDTEIYYMEIADVLDIEGEDTVWRLPSAFIDGICSKLPLGSGKSVTMENIGGRLAIESGRMKAQIGLISPEYYPQWSAFLPDDLQEVQGFGARLESVQWAASKDNQPPINGVHLNGEYVIATDRFKIAIAECKAPPIFKPITIPAGLLTPIIKNLTDVSLGVDHGQLLIMPNETTQIRAVLYGGDYPQLHLKFKRDEDQHITFKKSLLLESIDRAMVMGQRDRTPLLKLFFGEEEIAVYMSDEEIGLLGDIVEVPGYADHPRMVLGFTPGNLTGALMAAPNETVTIHYHLNQVKKPLRVDGGSGYEALVMPRSEKANG